MHSYNHIVQEHNIHTGNWEGKQLHDIWLKGKTASSYCTLDICSLGKHDCQNCPILYSHMTDRANWLVFTTDKIEAILLIPSHHLRNACKTMLFEFKISFIFSDKGLSMYRHIYRLSFMSLHICRQPVMSFHRAIPILIHQSTSFYIFTHIPNKQIIYRFIHYVIMDLWGRGRCWWPKL